MQIGIIVEHLESGAIGTIVASYGDSIAVKVLKGGGGYKKGDNALWLK